MLRSADEDCFPPRPFLCPLPRPAQRIITWSIKRRFKFQSSAKYVVRKYVHLISMTSTVIIKTIVRAFRRLHHSFAGVHSEILSSLIFNCELSEITIGGWLNGFCCSNGRSNGARNYPQWGLVTSSARLMNFHFGDETEDHQSSITIRIAVGGNDEEEWGLGTFLPFPASHQNATTHNSYECEDTAMFGTSTSLAGFKELH